MKVTSIIADSTETTAILKLAPDTLFESVMKTPYHTTTYWSWLQLQIFVGAYVADELESLFGWELQSADCDTAKGSNSAQWLWHMVKLHGLMPGRCTVLQQQHGPVPVSMYIWVGKWPLQMYC